jgi:hypothetical protein
MHQRHKIYLNEHRSFLVLLVDRDVGSKILWDGIYLPGGMAEVLVPIFSKLPELRLVVFHVSDEKKEVKWNFNIWAVWCIRNVEMQFSEELLVGKDWSGLHTTNIDPWFQFVPTKSRDEHSCTIYTN